MRWQESHSRVQRKRLSRHRSIALLRLPDDGPDTNRDVVVVEDVVKALRDIDIDIDERAAASGYEVEFVVAQFNRVGKFIHVTLLLYSLWVLIAPY
jgi:hypothetical protein